MELTKRSGLSRLSARNTLVFLKRVVEEIPFAIQRIQTDRGWNSSPRTIINDLKYRDALALLEFHVAEGGIGVVGVLHKLAQCRLLLGDELVSEATDHGR